MKKNLVMICLVIGLALLFGGLYLALNSNGNNNTGNEEVLLTTTEAEGRLKNTIANILVLYENPKEIFNVDKDEITLEKEKVKRLKVNNYDIIINGLFTEKGIQELEEASFSSNLFVKKEDGNTYVLATIPENKRYSTSEINLKNTTIQNSTITSLVTIGYSKMSDTGIPELYSMTIDIKLVKENSVWLVEQFNYNQL